MRRYSLNDWAGRVRPAGTFTEALKKHTETTSCRSCCLIEPKHSSNFVSHPIERRLPFVGFVGNVEWLLMKTLYCPRYTFARDAHRKSTTIAIAGWSRAIRQRFEHYHDDAVAWFSLKLLDTLQLYCLEAKTTCIKEHWQLNLGPDGYRSISFQITSLKETFRP